MARHGRVVGSDTPNMEHALLTNAPYVTQAEVDEVREQARTEPGEIRLRRVREARTRFAPDGEHTDYAMGWLDALHYVQYGELPDPPAEGVDAERVRE